MSTFATALLCLLAGALAVAAITDWRSRTIENWLSGAIAVGAPVWWWVAGFSPWPDAAIQVGLALAAFAVFAGFFALGAMGGGDVKLIAALALWFPVPVFLGLLITMAVLGGVLTLAVVGDHKFRRRPGRPEIPYGIAIAGAGLWVICRTIF